MKDSPNPKHGIQRRDLFEAVTAASLGLAAGVIGASNIFGQSSVSNEAPPKTGSTLQRFSR